MGGIRIPQVPSFWSWMDSFTQQSSKVIAEHYSYVCALLEPDEHWENPVGVWAQFQQLIPPEV